MLIFSEQKKIIAIVIAISVISFLFSLFSGGSLLALCSLVLLIPGFIFFWNPLPLRIILFILLLSWLQISINMLLEQWGIPLEQQIRFPAQFEKAYLLSCLALVCLGAGIYTVMHSIHFDQEQVVRQLKKINIPRWLCFYLAAFLIYGMMFQVPIFWKIPFFPYWRYFINIPLFICLLAVHCQKKYYWQLTMVLSFIFLCGFLGFFAGFVPLFFLIFLAILSMVKITFKTMLLAVTLGAAFLYVALFWTAVKPDFRAYLNQGTNAQVVLVSKWEAFSFLLDFAKNYQNSMDNFIILMNRIGYIDYFSSVLDYVPRAVNFEYGALSRRALTFNLIPRMFNPEKEVLDDSVDLIRYSGNSYKTREEGTSISMGLFSYFYVDYGPWGMFPMIYLFGCLVGFILRTVYRSGGDHLTGWLLLLPFFNVISPEKALVKEIGLLIQLTLIALILSFLVRKSRTSLWLSSKESRQ